MMAASPLSISRRSLPIRPLAGETGPSEPFNGVYDTAVALVPGRV